MCLCIAIVLIIFFVLILLSAIALIILQSQVIKVIKQYDNVHHPIQPFPVAPLSAIAINLNKDPYNISTIWNEELNVTVTVANCKRLKYHGTVAIAIHKGKVDCTYHELDLPDIVIKRDDTPLVRHWTTNTNARGYITCNDTIPTDNLIYVEWSNIINSSLNGSKTFYCSEGIDIAELYKNITIANNIDNEDLITVIFNPKAKVSIVMIECLPIPYPDAITYKQIVIECDGGDNNIQPNSVTMKFQGIYQEAHEKTESRLIINTMGLFSEDHMYNTTLVSLVPGRTRQVFWKIGTGVGVPIAVVVLFVIVIVAYKLRHGRGNHCN